MNMKTKPKKKLCWNCEGNVTLQAENCPYCGVYLSPGDEAKDHPFSPPYKNTQTEGNSEVPVAPYANQEKESSPISKEETELDQDKEQITTIVQPLALLLAGSMFFIFGLALLLFSHNGVFSLHWDGNYWYIYLLISLPMLGFGWMFMRNIKDVEE